MLLANISDENKLKKTSNLNISTSVPTSILNKKTHNKKKIKNKKEGKKDIYISSSFVAFVMEITSSRRLLIGFFHLFKFRAGGGGLPRAVHRLLHRLAAQSFPGFLLRHPFELLRRGRRSLLINPAASILPLAVPLHMHHQ